VAQCDYLTGSFYATFLTMTTVIVHYLKLLVLPMNLCADHLFFPVSTSMLNLKVIFSLSLICGLLIIGFLFAKKRKHLSFAIFWFFITLLPVLNIIPVKILLAERFLYMPLIGYALATAVIFRLLIIKFADKSIIRYMIFFSLGILIVFYSYLTMARNTVWADEVVFYEDIVQKYPENNRARFNLSVAYMRRENDLEKAYKEISEVIRIDPDNYRARMLRAAINVQRRNAAEALEELNYVTKLNKDKPEPYLLKAMIYILQGKYDSAYAQYEKMLSMDSSDLRAKNGIALLYRIRGDRDAAIKEYKKILLKDPSDDQRALYASIYLIMGELYVDSGRMDLAREMWVTVQKKFIDQVVLRDIASFLLGQISQETMVSILENLPPEQKVIGYYYIALKYELEGDMKNAEKYYQITLNIKTRSISIAQILAERRLRRKGTF